MIEFTPRFPPHLDRHPVWGDHPTTRLDLWRPHEEAQLAVECDPLSGRKRCGSCAARSANAVARELDRGGQVFYVHNRVQGIEQIQRRVAEHYDVRLADMTSKRRPASIAFPRQVAMYLARELTKASLNEIGDAFGGRDHGTVLHACKLVKKRMSEQDNLRQTISYIDSSLQR